MGTGMSRASTNVGGIRYLLKVLNGREAVRSRERLEEVSDSLARRSIAEPACLSTVYFRRKLHDAGGVGNAELGGARAVHLAGAVEAIQESLWWTRVQRSSLRRCLSRGLGPPR